jgi:hypothetical protein
MALRRVRIAGARVSDAPYALRPERKTDLAYVSAIMLREVIEKCIKGCTVRIACDVSDPDTILGFAIVDRENPTLLHYVYVRHALRGEGIEQALVRPEEVREYSLTSESFEELFNPKERGWTRAPFDL